ncbi:betaine--homocysteine S-methyltransferase [Ferruginivarius sediminum]|uniref:Betaine--homocysteine S-methyltransferase n=1 Tax=Ferruginivarius sediminum TaxID=2661937 RepID=A0A369TDR2_9PROT|nr:betaine--homocysteine S-methyltransferase [Ferruginivarius sediminum]RDD62515.1 betaine--homocysteine S-methyltransferase [Ferruginivarius sediminum]
MTDLLSRLLAERPWLLADGATGTNLFALGLGHGDSPELWNADHPDKVRAHYRSFLEAGSDIILTNTFGGNRERLKLHGGQDRVYELNKAAAELARAEVGRLDRPAVVAGSMGPTGSLFQPLGELSFEDGKDAFAEQAAGLKDGGVDVLWIETISAVDELKAAVAGAGTAGLPVACTLSFDTNGRTMMGVTPDQLAQIVHGLEPRPIAYGGNCGVGASELVVALHNMAKGAEPGDVLIAKSNCGIPEWRGDQIVYTGTPELMADYACIAVDCGARIIGGCCGTTPEHIRAMRAALEAHTKGEAPSVEEIVARLGQISTGAEQQSQNTGLSDLPESESASAGGRRRRSRRRASAGPEDDTPKF